MNKEGTQFKILFGILFTIITINIVPILIKDSNILAQQEQGITPTDPKNVTNQTLQDYPTEDKDLSTGIENNLTDGLTK
ncbi:MAG: hypothetical protein ACRD8K_02715 [Nitrososphaeraceae archaeon]